MRSINVRFFNLRLTTEQIFWSFVGLHLVVWTVVPALVCPNAPLDVIEGYAWGREWLIGTHKHPPMQAWWLEIFEHLTFHTAWGHFLASQVAVAITFWAVWQTGVRMLGAVPALFGVLLLEGIIYYNFTSPEFNPNVLQLPFWALIGLSYYRGVKDNRMIDWGLLGVAAAGGLYSKYSTVLLLASLAILTLARPESRRRFQNIGPYLSFAIALVLFMPHILWLIHNNFLPFSYAEERLHQANDLTIVKSKVQIPFFFVFSQVLAMLPAVLMFISLLGRRKTTRDETLRNFDKAFLNTVTFGPCFLVLIAELFFGLNIHDMWAMPFWSFIGLWVLTYFQPAMSPASLRRFEYSFLIVSVGIVIAYAGSTIFYPYLTGKTQRVQFPGHMLAINVTNEWHRRFNRPLEYAIGNMWPAGNIAYYTADRPHVYIRGDLSISPWINPDDVEKKGGVLVWCVANCAYSRGHEEPPDFVKQFPDAEMQKPLSLPRKTDAQLEPVIIGWAIVPPKDALPSTDNAIK